MAASQAAVGAADAVRPPKSPRSESRPGPRQAFGFPDVNLNEQPPMVPAVVSQRSQELAKARDSIGLLTQPLRTCGLFFASVYKFVYHEVLVVALSRFSLFVVYPLLLVYASTRIYEPELYKPPSCGGATHDGGALYLPELYVFEAIWWVTLGILSSIGFGSGLHSGIMFLWPHVMQVVMTAESVDSTHFSAVYNHKCVFESWGKKGDGSLTFFNQLVLVWPAVILWGAGTAIGELPPYFITRTARLAGKRDDTFEAELLEAKSKTDIISKLKVWTITFTERTGFLGILLLASWPNAAFDMCGMACGWLNMPFWTFFGATLLGKSVIKTTIQSAVCIGVFSPHFFWTLEEALESVDYLDIDLGPLATGLRQAVMQKFELQARMTSKDLLGKATALDELAIARKYCAVGHKCGHMNRKGEFADSEAFEEAKAVAARIVHRWDRPSPVTHTGDGKLDAFELHFAESKTDGKLSLASLDPGTSHLFSPGNLWNLFLAGLVLFFLVSIVEQLAKAEQAERDAHELEKLEAELKSSQAAAGKKD